MTAWLQPLIVLLNRTSLVPVLRRIYSFALRRLLAALAGQPAVFCVFGCGSYFEGRCVYGLSDIDLIIVLREQVKRSDGAPREIVHAYERLRRVFPFLGGWHEKEANLIFLSDVAAGFPLSESFRLRLKQGRLMHLYGEALPPDLVTGRVTASEVLVELDTLLRSVLVTDEQHTRRLVFWKRTFTKLMALAALLDLTELTAQMRALPEIAFLADDETSLFFRRGEPDRLFSLQLALTRRVCEAIQARTPSVRSRFVLVPPREPPPMAVPDNEIWFSAMVRRLECGGRVSVRTLGSVPIGIAGGLLYFSIDQRIPVVEFGDNGYRAIRSLQRVLHRYGKADENLLASAEDFLFIVTRQPTFVDVVPLDPLQYANVYAAYRDDPLVFDMPADVLAEQRAKARAVFAGLAHSYRVHDGWVDKLPYPCIYREDDAEVIESAFRILRACLASAEERILIQASKDLVDYLGGRYPECRSFLAELQRYRRHLGGDEPVANNVYHCLHQFMWQLLSGANEITLDPAHKHLGITVGVITRNRATDLEEMLDSLTRQVRPPDEVLVVDNGSTDQTHAVLERYRERLPIRCKVLPEASIPRARNLVIEEAAHEIVSFIDDDCISEPQWLAAVERGFLRADNIGIVGGWVHHEPAKRPSAVDNYYRVFHHTKS